MAGIFILTGSLSDASGLTGICRFLTTDDEKIVLPGVLGFYQTLPFQALWFYLMIIAEKEVAA